MTIRKHDVTKMLLAVRAAGLEVERVEADLSAAKIVVYVASARPEQIVALNGRDLDQPKMDAPAISEAAL